MAEMFLQIQWGRVAEKYWKHRAEICASFQPLLFFQWKHSRNNFHFVHVFIPNIIFFLHMISLRFNCGAENRNFPEKGCGGIARAQLNNFIILISSYLCFRYFNPRVFDFFKRTNALVDPFPACRVFCGNSSQRLTKLHTGIFGNRLQGGGVDPDPCIFLAPQFRVSSIMQLHTPPTQGAAIPVF